MSPALFITDNKNEQESRSLSEDAARRRTKGVRGGAKVGAEGRATEPRAFHKPRGRARLMREGMLGLRPRFCCELEGCAISGEVRREKELEENEIETGNGILSRSTPPMK